MYQSQPDPDDISSYSLYGKIWQLSSYFGQAQGGQQIYCLYAITMFGLHVDV